MLQCYNSLGAMKVITVGMAGTKGKGGFSMQAQTQMPPHSRPQTYAHGEEQFSKYCILVVTNTISDLMVSYGECEQIFTPSCVYSKSSGFNRVT